jgi:hypothetical protein
MTNIDNAGLDFMRQRYGIDTAMAQSLLSAALSRGGEYAELYFEHKTAGNILFEQQAVNDPRCRDRRQDRRPRWLRAARRYRQL